MPGVTLEKVQENTEFELEAALGSGAVEVPTGEELNILRQDVDPGREYLGKGD